MSALQQGNFCSFGVVNLDRQPVVKIIRQRGVNLVRQEVIFYASFSITVGKIGDVAPAPKVKVMTASTPKQAVSKTRADAKANGTTVNRQQRIATEKKAKQSQKTAESVNNSTAKTPQNTVASGTSETIKQQTDEKR